VDGWCVVQMHLLVLAAQPKQQEALRGIAMWGIAVDVALMLCGALLWMSH